MKLPEFNLPTIRNYFNERNFRIKVEQRVYDQANANDDTPDQFYIDSDVKRIFRAPRHYEAEIALTRAQNAELSRIKQILIDEHHLAHEPFEFFTELKEPLPQNRIPSPGIKSVPRKWHFGRIVKSTETTPETGFDPHPRILEIIQTKYPQYLPFIEEYCRPLGTTDATFADFNREQVTTQPIPKDRLARILKHVKRKLHAKPYRPLHYIDTAYAGLPTNTATGYHNRHSYRMKAHAKASAPPEYKEKPTTKGYFYNAFHEYTRFIVHLIKETGLPFKADFDENTSEQDILDKLNDFIDSYPTLLFTRTHISKRYGNLKQRPVYAVDELFLLIETMLLFPLLTQARSPDSCIMYGLETIRGSNSHIDKIAQNYLSFFMIDWSSYDQCLPHRITDTFYTDFVPSLLVINSAYQPTYEYPTYPGLTTENMYKKMNNLLQFLHLWFNNMTFLSQDGFGYRRTTAGVPSGQLATQYLDSYGNLVLIIDALIEFEATDQEIDEIHLMIMGDDNTGMTNWPISRLSAFIEFFTDYAKTRWNMTINKSKSTTTTIRNKIETLGYTCNSGRPRRPIDKLVAQLCYPERSTKTRHVASRAIGLAYASCACDITYYSFCKDVYNAFRSDQDLDVPLEKLSKILPSSLLAAEDVLSLIDFSTFPTIDEIERMCLNYKGPLSFFPKWKYFHFKHSPDHVPDDYITMQMFQKINNLPAPSTTIQL